MQRPGEPAPCSDVRGRLSPRRHPHPPHPPAPCPPPFPRGSVACLSDASFYFTCKLNVNAQVCGNFTSGFNRTSALTPWLPRPVGPRQAEGRRRGGARQNPGPRPALAFELRRAPSFLKGRLLWAMKEELRTRLLWTTLGSRSQAAAGGRGSRGRQGRTLRPQERAEEDGQAHSRAWQVSKQMPGGGRDSSSKVTGTLWGQRRQLCGLIFATCCEKSLYRPWETLPGSWQ